MTVINIFTENIFDSWKVNEKDVINKTRQMLEHYIAELRDKSCLYGKKYTSITLDILFCDSSKTQEYNRDYRGKDYPADIITFAIFADDENSFIFDGDVNLGEIVIALDKVIEGVNRDVSKSENKEQELFFGRLAFGVVTPGAAKIAAFEEHGGANARPVDVRVQPSDSGNGLDFEDAGSAAIAAPPVHQVDFTQQAHIRSVKGGLALTGVDIPHAFHADAERRGHLFRQLHACRGTHALKERAVLQRGDDTALHTERPVIKKLRPFKQFLTVGAECARCEQQR